MNVSLFSCHDKAALARSRTSTTRVSFYWPVFHRPKHDFELCDVGSRNSAYAVNLTYRDITDIIYRQSREYLDWDHSTSVGLDIQTRPTRFHVFGTLKTRFRYAHGDYFHLWSRLPKLISFLLHWKFTLYVCRLCTVTCQDLCARHTWNGCPYGILSFYTLTFHLLW